MTVRQAERGRDERVADRAGVAGGERGDRIAVDGELDRWPGRKPALDTDDLAPGRITVADRLMLRSSWLSPLAASWRAVVSRALLLVRHAG